MLAAARLRRLKDVWTIPIAALVAGVAGFLFGIPALRLSGLYLALATFGIAVATPAVLKKFDDFTGGGGGINLFGDARADASSPARPSSARTLTYNNWLYYLTWTIALVLLAVAWLLLRGRTGRAFRAVRDSEIAAVSSGVSLARYKTLAFGVSAAYAGIAGSLFAIATPSSTPTPSRSRCRSTWSSASSSAASARSRADRGARCSSTSCPLWAQPTVVPDCLPVLGDLDPSSAGAPAVFFGAVLILLMFVLPRASAGLLRRLGSPNKPGATSVEVRRPSLSRSLDR